ncbi:MAG: two-component system response regulator AtoC, partial [Pirellulaceae bacterium]
KPLIVGFLRDREAKKAVRAIDCEFVAVSSRNQILTTEYPQHPRLLVVEVLAHQVDATRVIVKTLRHERPLTDILLWAPQAKAAAVRELFRAGAKDVVVSRSASKLVESIDEILTEQQILPRLNELSRQRNKTARFESMLSRSAAMWDLFDLCTRIAPADATVLIVGETGTGKELLARAVHRRSGRPGRFVAVNCASVPPALINSELFGHEKGAFTGADRSKTGLVTHAQEGTLFLDEIGDMTSEAQQSLLRMLQEKRVRPVGSLIEKEIDVRVVAATNVPLDKAVGAGEFREDLFYRLDVIRMNIPPLRNRHEDILFLFGHFTKKLAKHYGLNPPTYAESFLDALLEHEWPGNVRQLENFSERLVLARPQRTLTARDFVKLSSTGLAAGRQTSKKNDPVVRTHINTLKPLQENIDPLIERQEREYLESVLKQNEGRIAATAEQAGISRRTLLRKMKLHQLDKQTFK